MSMTLPATPLSASDKHLWHRYTPVYDAALAPLGPVERIVEFGVFRGDSIRWLRALFPQASIVGVDILPPAPEWPRDDGIAYRQLDQGDAAGLAAFFAGIGGGIDLLIEDGSHVPVHQAACLVAGLPRLRRGGLYILEDIHTSHPAHPLSVQGPGRDEANALKVLLAIQHLKDAGLPLDAARRAALASATFFSGEEIAAVHAAAHSVELFRRASLPLRCWSCGTSDFDYARLACTCGAELYAEADSMTALVVRG